MSENKLMDKLVARFNKVFQEMETRINELNLEIRRLELEDNKVVREENEVVEEINRTPLINRGYLLGERRELLKRHDALVKKHDNLVAERDSLKKKLENILALPIEKKAEAYYNSLCKQMQSANSEQEYTALADKFSDISEYKDCAELAEKCKKQVQKLQEEEQERREKEKRDRKIQAAIKHLDDELKTKLKPLDDEIAELEKEEHAVFGWVILAGGVLGIILALIVKGGVGYAILGGVVGLIIGFIIGTILDSNIERKNKQKLQELENQKSTLRSECDRIKDIVRSGGNIRELFIEFRENADKIVRTINENL